MCFCFLSHFSPLCSISSSLSLSFSSIFSAAVIDLEVGGNNYNKQSVNINGATKKSHYSLSAANLSTDGISAKTGEYDDPDDDGYKNQNVTLKAGHEFNKTFSVDGVMRYTRSESEYDVKGVNYADIYTKVLGDEPFQGRS